MNWSNIKVSDAIGGLVFLALGLSVVLYAPSLNRGGGLGGGTFPLAIGVLLTIAGFGIFVGTFFRAWLASIDPDAAADLDFAEPDDARSGLKWSFASIAPVASIPVAIIVYALAVRITGASFMNFATVAVVAWIWGLSIGRALVLGAASAIAFYAFFTLGLGVHMPSGFIEEAVRQWI